MSAVRTAAGALLRSRDRATSVLTVAAFALPHAFLLAVTGGVMAFGARAAVAATSATGDDPSTLDGMAPFYVMLAYFAATLLIVPIISMGAAAARLGMSRRERDLAVLRLVGLAPGKTKLACILETCVFAAVGVVVGSILYAVTLPAWGALSFQGRPMGVGEMWVGGRCPPRRGARYDPPGRPVLVASHAHSRNHTPGRRAPYAGGAGERGRPRPRRRVDRGQPADSRPRLCRSGACPILHGVPARLHGP